MKGWLACMLLILLLLPEKEVQGQDWLVPSDTSYFRSGEDDWNLVESVLLNQPSNAFLLLNRGANPDARAEGGMTALMYATEMGDSLLVALLVANGASLDLTYVENTTPLLVSVLNQHFGITHYLLQKGADPNHRDEMKVTPLIYAAALNDYQTTDLLLFYGAADSVTDMEGNTALMTAVFFGNLETADVLLQNGLSPQIPDRRGFTPLMVAAQKGNSEMIKLLQEYDAPLEQEDSVHYTALAHAIRFDQSEAAKILIDSGANVYHQISANRNLYDLAVQYSGKEILEMLKSKGAGTAPRPDFTEFDFGWGNSFNAKEHMMQVRVSWVDRKFGFFAETGYDFRPVYRKVQNPGEDEIIYQYREFRSVWTHGAGKLFRLLRDPAGIQYGVYGGLYGMLSFGSYRGLEEHPKPHYSLVPSLGVFMQGRIAGLKAGTERYQFGTLYERPWKVNITMYLRINSHKAEQLHKEIIYENH